MPNKTEKLLKKFSKKVYKLFLILGIDLRKTILALRALPLYVKDYLFFKSQKSESRKFFPIIELNPCLEDKYNESGTAKGHYFYQDLLVAQRIFLNNPEKHLDIGSRIDGFVAHVASFRKVEVMDIRPLKNTVKNVSFIQADLMSSIGNERLEYTDSLSCLHAIEHFGLGRYGDPIKFDGFLLGLGNIYKILKTNGKLYLSVPIGPQRIEFNAHRVFSVEFLLKYFEDKFRIDYFSYVDDDGELFEKMELKSGQITNNFGCYYGCGIFEMTKL